MKKEKKKKKLWLSEAFIYAMNLILYIAAEHDSYWIKENFTQVGLCS